MMGTDSSMVETMAAMELAAEAAATINFNHAEFVTQKMPASPHCLRPSQQP
jgi:hypothetical protein